MRNMFQFRQIFYSILSILVISCLIQCQNDEVTQGVQHDMSNLKEDYFEDYEAPTHKWGYINKAGEQVVSGKYDLAKSFSEGRAAVNHEGLWGYIDSQGIEIIKPQYMKASSFSNGLASVRDFEGKIGFINYEGTLIIPHKYKTTGNFHHGISSVRMDEMYGYINTKGQSIIEPIFTKVWPFYNKNIARVQIRKRYVLIDSKGKVLTEEMDKIFSFSENYYRFKKNSQYGILDSLAQVIIPAEYDQLSSVTFGHVILKIENQWILKNILNGTEIGRFDQSVTIIGDNQLRYNFNGQFGLYDFQGNILTKAIYDQINHYSEGRSIALKNDKWAILNGLGKMVTDSTYTLLWDTKDGMTKVINHRAIGFLDTTSKIVIPEIYLEAKSFFENRSAVKISN